MGINEFILSEISNFLKTYYSNQFACLISGSYIDGKNNKYSDIDVLVFTKDRKKLFSETLPYNDLKIQVIIIPVQSIQEILWVDYTTCKGAYVDMLSKGKILFDNHFFLKNLVEHSKKLQLLGGQPLNEDVVYMTRVRITSLLDDIMGGNDVDELFFSISALVDELTILKLRFSGNWCGEGKHRMRQILALDEKFGTNLVNNIKEIYKNGNKTPLINWVKDSLKPYGGLLPYYSSLGHSFSKVTSDCLVIQVNAENKDDPKSIVKTIKIIGDFLDNLNSFKINYYFFFSAPIGKRNIVQNIYIAVETNEDFINNYLVDRLKFLISNKKGLVGLIFPFQFDPVYRFSDKILYGAVVPVFYKISQILIGNVDLMFDKNFQIKFSLTLFKELKNIWFENDSEKFILFLEYLMDCWHVYSYDDGLNSNTTEILRKKNLNLKEFNTSYSSQKEYLKNTYFKDEFNSKEVISYLQKIPKMKEIDNIPSYKSYLLGAKISHSNSKQWSFYKEFIYRMLSIILIDNQFISYIPFVILKLEKK